MIKLGTKEDYNKGRYHRLVSKLIYLSHTRLAPDIGYLVSMVSQFMINPNEENMEAVYKILVYLKLIPEKGLYFRKSTNKSIKIYKIRIKKCQVRLERQKDNTMDLIKKFIMPVIKSVK